MSNRLQVWSTMLAASSILLVPAVARGQQAGGQPTARNMSEMKFSTVPGLPTCAPGSVQSGDPSKGPSVIIAKQAAGCSIPWHWHTPNEHLMIVTGTARVEAKDGKPFTLRAGGFAMMPSRHVHQFRCTSACVLYVYSDAAFDIHYVDAQGKEISPDDALKAVKETAAKGMK
jgi:quercetin dioxygenase-like cupin family protein